MVSGLENSAGKPQLENSLIPVRNGNSHPMFVFRIDWNFVKVSISAITKEFGHAGVGLEPVRAGHISTLVVMTTFLWACHEIFLDFILLVLLFKLRK